MNWFVIEHLLGKEVRCMWWIRALQPNGISWICRIYGWHWKHIQVTMHAWYIQVTSKRQPSDIHVVMFASRYRRVHSCKGLVGKDISAARQPKQNKPKTTQYMVSHLFSPIWIVLIVIVSMPCSHHPSSFNSCSILLPPIPPPLPPSVHCSIPMPVSHLCAALTPVVIPS